MISYQQDEKDARKKDQLSIDKTILRDCRKRHTNLGIAWIAYKKAYDMVSHFWILESLELVQVSDNILQFARRSTELNSCREVWQKLTSGEGFFRVIVCHLCYLWYARYWWLMYYTKPRQHAPWEEERKLTIFWLWVI